MGNFEKYIREDKAVHDSLAKLPASHRKLVSGYDVRFEPGNTLKNDPGHVGRVYLGGKNKTITIASPWNYGREFTLFHEIAHFVYNSLCSPEWKKKWKKVSRVKNLQENDEERWCMAYANHFAKHKVMTYSNPKWDQYMNDFCGQS